MSDGLFLDADRVLACSVKYHVLKRVEKVYLLKNGWEAEHLYEVVMEIVYAGKENLLGNHAAQFSPDGHNFFSVTTKEGILYIFSVDHDTIKSKSLCQIPIHGKFIDHCWLRFFGSKKLVCCRKKIELNLTEVELVKILIFHRQSLYVRSVRLFVLDMNAWGSLK